MSLGDNLTHSIKIEHAVVQMSKGQDYVCNGNGINPISGEKFQWIMLNDGHGTDSCINFIRSMSIEKKTELISQSDPIRAIASYIDTSWCVTPFELSGSTAIILKCYKDRAECITCGDSQAIIFKDGKIMHITKEHNYTNREERIRIINDMGYGFTSSNGIKIVGEFELEHMNTEYVNFNDGKMLACTQALGHNSKTGYNPSTFIFKYEENASYRVVIASDGLFDMLMLDNENDIQILKTKTSKKICEWIVDRWLHEWTAYFRPGILSKFNYKREDCDDISVAIAEITSQQIKNL